MIQVLCYKFESREQDLSVCKRTRDYLNMGYRQASEAPAPLSEPTEAYMKDTIQLHYRLLHKKIGDSWPVEQCADIRALILRTFELLPQTEEECHALLALWSPDAPAAPSEDPDATEDEPPDPGTTGDETPEEDFVSSKSAAEEAADSALEALFEARLEEQHQAALQLKINSPDWCMRDLERLRALEDQVDVEVVRGLSCSRVTDVKRWKK